MISKTHTQKRARKSFRVALAAALATLSYGSVDTAYAEEFSTLQANEGMLSSESSEMPASFEIPMGFAPSGIMPVAAFQDAETEDAEESEEEEEEEESELELLTAKFDDFEEKLAEMEESIDEVAEEAGDPSIVHSGSSKSTMKVSGRVHVDAWGFDNDEGVNQFAGGDDEPNRLGFRRLRFGVKGDVKDNMVYKIEMELAGGNASEFRDAYLGWKDLAFFQKVLVGNQKRPFGLDHLNSSRFNVFIERPFVIEAFNEDARRLGVQSYGVSEDQAWNWRYGVFNQRNVQDEGNYVGDHLQLQIAGRMANTAWYDEISDGRGYAHWAVSGAHADVSTDALAESRFRTRPEARTTGTRYIDTGQIAGADYYNLIGFEGVVNVGAFQVVGEYQSNWVERNGFDDVRLDGGYVYASYFLTGEHIPWDRSSGTIGRVKPFQNFWLVDKCDGCREAGWGAWQLAARYSQADFSNEDIFGGEGEALTVGMNWHWNSNARMQFNYITGKIENSTVGNRGGAPIEGNYDVWGARFMIDF